MTGVNIKRGRVLEVQEGSIGAGPSRTDLRSAVQCKTRGAMTVTQRLAQISSRSQEHDPANPLRALCGLLARQFKP
ncbi:hypothetical protein WN48_03671 [Eufriesea mexicana]|uniref:Uncharacterized protein n=1 Tax=Eufriesea mexicana TaxID=516756 RepID=A0A310ST12_9HYME|nr:hypothetical protein WN48_03671 [Eufriesea mexicana]